MIVYHGWTATEKVGQLDSSAPMALDHKLIEIK